MINAPFRDHKKHPCPVTVWFLSEAISKLQFEKSLSERKKEEVASRPDNQLRGPSLDEVTEEVLGFSEMASRYKLQITSYKLQVTS